MRGAQARRAMADEAESVDRRPQQRHGVSVQRFAVRHPVPRQSVQDGILGIVIYGEIARKRRVAEAVIDKPFANDEIASHMTLLFIPFITQARV